MVSSYRLEKLLGCIFIMLSFIVLIFDIAGKFVPYIVDCIPQFTIVCISIYLISKRRIFNDSLYILYIIYFLYLLISIIHGIQMCENYWHVKNLYVDSLALTIPLFAVLFTRPQTALNSISIWMRIAVPAYVLLFAWITKSGYGHIVMGPAYFLIGVFFFWIPGKWKVLIGLLLLILIARNFFDRSQVLKGLLTVFMATAVYFRNYISIYLIQFLHWTFYLVALLLLVLGLTGTFNIFNPFDSENIIIGKDMLTNEQALVSEEDNLDQDTRTFLYMETISSAIIHDYVLFGRSPARGHDTEFPAFVQVAEEMDPNYIERIQDEFSLPSIFTWLGIVGVLLYSLLFLQASFLGLYRSKSIFIKYLSVLIAFHWAYGWIEDCIKFDLMNVGLWLIIGICLSPQFRSMTDKEFELWFKSFFSKTKISPYEKRELSKELTMIKNYRLKEK